jgi:hypothetical protein
VTLTEKGLYAARQLSTTLHEPITAALSEVPPENRGIIGRFLRHFNTELNRRSTVTGTCGGAALNKTMTDIRDSQGIKEELPTHERES